MKQRFCTWSGNSGIYQLHDW